MQQDQASDSSHDDINAIRAMLELHDAPAPWEQNPSDPCQVLAGNGGTIATFFGLKGAERALLACVAVNIMSGYLDEDPAD